mgnify:FL=1
MFETMQKIAIAVLVGMAAVGAIQDWSRDVPSVTADYYTQTQTGGEIEEIYTAMGEYDVDYAEYPAQDLLIKQYKIWYPSALAGEEGREWPIVVMANGTGVPASRYAPVFRHLASWGFVVIGNEMQNSWSGGASAGALDLLAELNEDPSSLFYHKLDLDNVGSAGHSQGAIGAINAVTAQPNGDSYKALYLASTPSSLYASTLEWAYDPALIDVPCFMTAGTGLLDAGEAGSPEVAEEAQEVSISPLWSQEENYGLIPDSVPKLRARRTGADHAEMLPWPDGYMTAWFMYWLQGDEAAGRAFFGPDAEIVHNPLWQDIEKNL